MHIDINQPVANIETALKIHAPFFRVLQQIASS